MRIKYAIWWSKTRGKGDSTTYSWGKIRVHSSSGNNHKGLGWEKLEFLLHWIEWILSSKPKFKWSAISNETYIVKELILVGLDPKIFGFSMPGTQAQYFPVQLFQQSITIYILPGTSSSWGRQTQHSSR